MKNKLDYLLIPDSGKKVRKQREKRAIEEMSKRSVGKIILLTGSDSEEDVLFLGKILKEGNRIGIDTFSTHYKEYKDLIRKAVKQGKFPRKIKIENVKTSETFKEKIYGELGLYDEKIFHREIKLRKRRNKFLSASESIIKRIINLV